MTLTTYPDLVQGTDEWLQARAGIVTASTVGRLLTSTQKVGDNLESRGLTLTLAAERITGYVDPTYVSADMWRGVEDEPRAREAYAESRGTPVDELGFMVREIDGHRLGYSPDGLVSAHGLIEIKSRRQKQQLTTILDDAVPAANMAQLQAGLLVSGRQWIDYVSFCGGMPLYVKRVFPEQRWFDAIRAALATFEERIAAILTDYSSAVQGLPLTERAPDYTEVVI